MEALKMSVDIGTLGILGVMSFIVVAYAIERYSFYKNVDIRAFKTKNQADEALTENLATMSIIGSNAPYVGLLGTVAGIMVVFYEIGQSGGLDPAQVVIGLSLALKATALGLLVAIPTTMIYGAYMRKVDILMGRWEDAQGDK